MKIIKLVLLLVFVWGGWTLQVSAHGLDPLGPPPRQKGVVTRIYIPLVWTEGTNPEWLAHLNTIRSHAGVSLVRENSTWNEEIVLHARYMVKNDALTHGEDVTNPWYSEAGAVAGQSNNLWVTGLMETTPTSILDHWIMAPFHGVALLDPELQTVGYGEYREEDGNIQVGAGLDVQRGLTTTVFTSNTFPIMFPANGTTVAYTQMDKEEYPDPMTGCPGYTLPSGAPIYLQVGAGDIVPRTGTHTLYGEGKMLPHCVFDETSYRHPDPNEQYVGRMILDMRDAIVLIPRQPLMAGETYEVSIEVDGTVHHWSFTVAEVQV